MLWYWYSIFASVNKILSLSLFNRSLWNFQNMWLLYKRQSGMHVKELNFVNNYSLPASVFHDVQTASATCQSLAAEVEFYQTSSVYSWCTRWLVRVHLSRNNFTKNNCNRVFVCSLSNCYCYAATILVTFVGWVKSHSSSCQSYYRPLSYCRPKRVADFKAQLFLDVQSVTFWGDKVPLPLWCHAEFFSHRLNCRKNDSLVNV